MTQTEKVKNKSIEEPKKKLECLLVLSAFFIGYLYIYIYQNMLHIEVKLIDFQTLIQKPLIALVILPLILYLIIKADPLQRSPSQRKSIRFFQDEFPSKYLLERCKKCIEDESSCRNYIKPESCAHVRYWFYDIFHGEIEKENPMAVKDTFAKGYRCKLVYYFSWSLSFFVALAIGTVVFHHVYLYLFDEFRIVVTASQILFPLVSVGVIILIKTLNRADASRPSGCWQAWREVNRMNVSWLRSHEDFLVNLICHAGGEAKEFREK